MEIPKRNFALSRRLMAAEELPISLWWSQVTSHKELVEILQYSLVLPHLMALSLV